MKISDYLRKTRRLPKLIRRHTALLLAVLLALFSTGCFSLTENNKNSDNRLTTELHADEDNAAFAEFVDGLFRETVTSDSLTLHSYLEHPEKYGITDYEITLGRYDLDNLDSTTDITDCINSLKSFDRHTLSAKQQITYDQLLQYMQNELEYSDLYLFDTSLSTTIGLQVQLPIIFAEYSFIEEKDVREYIGLLTDTDGFFRNLVDYEKLRSQNGYCMADSLLDEIIEQCETFIDSAKDGYLISTFNEKLDALGGISDTDKAAYKEQNRTAVEQHVIAGYQILADGLKQLKGSGKYSGGLCNYPNGDKYFEYLIRRQMGWSKTVTEYDTLLNTYIQKNMAAMQILLTQNPTLLDQFDQFGFSLKEPEAILSDLKTKITEDFPAGPQVNCEIKYITEALQDYASPAMYFTPQIDNLASNSIYINPGSANASDLYTTIAHEGYPGHMYQITYFANSGPDLIRYLIEPGGYIEGWATYCELYSYALADTGNANLNALARANFETILCLYAKVDIGVNYNGWKADDVYQFISAYGYSDREVAESMYSSMISEPGNYCQYVLGYIGFNELKNTAQAKLGGSFNLKEFHQYILDLGPVPFDMLNSRLDDWVRTAQYK